MSNTTIYVTDYRSPPSGCGTIVHEDGTTTLIQYKNCNPDIIGEVHENIVYIDYDFGSEEYSKANEALIELLKENNVTEIQDYDLADDMGLNCEKNIPLNMFVEFTRFYY